MIRLLSAFLCRDYWMLDKYCYFFLDFQGIWYLKPFLAPHKVYFRHEKKTIYVFWCWKQFKIDFHKSCTTEVLEKAINCKLLHLKLKLLHIPTHQQPDSNRGMSLHATSTPCSIVLHAKIVFSSFWTKAKKHSLCQQGLKEETFITCERWRTCQLNLWPVP